MGVNKSGKRFCVVLEKLGNQPLMTTKVLMQAVGLGLSEAKKMVDSIPVTVASELKSEKAIKLKEQLESIGNVVSIPDLEAEIIEKSVSKKKTIVKAAAKKEKTIEKADEQITLDFEGALAKVYEIVGREGFRNGNRVCNLLGDLVPKLEKERRRVKLAYAANAVTVLINETDKTFAVSEAVKRMVDYSDISENIANATILAIYEALK